MLAKSLIYLVVPFATHYFASLIQILCHRLFGHRALIPELYRIHAAGHHANYPPSRLQSVSWIANEQHITWYYLVPFAPLLLVLYLLTPLDLFFLFVTALIASVWLHIYLHRHYHLETTWLTRFAWFRRKQHLHFVHHCHPHKNYAIIEFFWDKVMKTYQKKFSRSIDRHFNRTQRHQHC